MTGNDFTKLYEPLRRPGRMRLFAWEPTLRERMGVVCSIFPERQPTMTEVLATRFQYLPLSFYADLRSVLIDRVLQAHYPTVAAQADAIRELLTSKQTLAVSAASLSDDDVLRAAEQLAQSFNISNHLGRSPGPTPQGGH